MPSRRKDFTDLTGRQCTSPNCRLPAVKVRRSPDRRGRMHTRLLCAMCVSKTRQTLKTWRVEK